MLSQLDRYIGKSVLASIMLVLLVVVGLDFLFAVMDQMGDVTDRYPMSAMLQYIGLTTPRRFYEFIPLSSLVGCLIGLGALASGSELTVMRAAGVSIWRIVMAVLKPVLMLAALAMVLGEYVVPHTEPLAESQRASRLSSGAISSAYGVWHREGEEYIHINVVNPDGQIQGITRYGFNQDRSLKYSSFATSGQYRDDRWLLTNVQETRFLEDRTELISYEQQEWLVKLTPQRLAVVIVEPEELPISGLYSYSRYLEEQELDNNVYMLAFWRKALQPLTIIGLVLVAVSFIFGPLRSVTTGQRIVSGVVVGMIFKFSQDLLAPTSALYDIAPVWAALGPIMVCVLLGAWLLKRAG